MSKPLQPLIDEFAISNPVPITEMRPAIHVTLPMGWRNMNHAIKAARRPFNEGKKAVLVAVVYFSAIAIVNRARQSQLPSNTPRFTTVLVRFLRETMRMHIPAGKSVTISQKEKTIGSMRPSASLETE